MKKIIRHDPNLREISKKNRRFVLLDTSFIISAVRNKIDVFEELKEYQILIPKQVINEIKKIIDSKKKLHLRDEAKLAQKIISKNKFSKVDLGKGHTDKLILKYSRLNPNLVVATLDREIKLKLSNPSLVIRGKKKLEII